MKRSRGGLRDIHLLRWVGFAEHGEADPDRLAMIGAMSKFEHHRLQSAQTFLLKLRNEMHFHAGSGKDLLDRAEQLRMAEVLGYRGAAGMLPVEQFMRDYFRHTNHVWQMVRRREASLHTASAMARVLDPVLGRTVEGDYRIGVRNIGATRTGLAKLQGSLEEVLRLVELSIRERQAARPRHDLGAACLPAPDVSEDVTPAIAERFLELLAPARGRGARDANAPRAGIPRKNHPADEARPVPAAVQPVPQIHGRRAHAAGHRSAPASSPSATDRLGDAYREIADKTLLHLVLLLHDLGKGYEEDHSELGRRIALEMRPAVVSLAATHGRRRLPGAKHLSMSHLAFRRDTGDREVVRRFAAEVATPERLRMLYVVDVRRPRGRRSRRAHAVEGRRARRPLCPDAGGARRATQPGTNCPR